MSNGGKLRKAAASAKGVRLPNQKQQLKALEMIHQYLVRGLVGMVNAAATGDEKITVTTMGNMARYLLEQTGVKLEKGEPNVGTAKEA